MTRGSLIYSIENQFNDFVDVIKEELEYEQGIKNELVSNIAWSEHDMKHIRDEAEYDLGYSEGFINAIEFVLHQLEED